MAKITLGTSAKIVRAETSLRTGKTEWEDDDRYWRDFLKIRREFLGGLIKKQPSIAEILFVEEQFKTFVASSSNFWWGGWTDQDLVKWHVNQYLRTLKDDWATSALAESNEGMRDETGPAFAPPSEPGWTGRDGGM